MAERTRVPRATRYEIKCSLVFKPAGDDNWQHGTLRNMSESGLLFVPQAPVADGADLEMTIPMPPPGIGTIWCRAIVVRREAATLAIAGRITEYRLLRDAERSRV